MDSEKIERSAMETLKISGYPGNALPVDIIKVAKELGFVVGNAVLDDNDDGFIIVEEGRSELMGIQTDKLIGVNSSRSLEWKRFIIAHEIGHYILEYKEKKLEGLYANRYHARGHNSSENEIDFFAANLLMPRDLFIEKYNKMKLSKSDRDVLAKSLAEYFIVTKRMVDRRIEELDLA